MRKFLFLLLAFGTIFCIFAAAYAQPAQIWKTGQTTSYGAGDDGDLERGVAWPSPRFEDNADGTVTDHLTGLIWLKNANCAGAITWSQALNFCNTLSSGSCGLTDGSVAGEWRLPNRKELISLVDYGRYNPALPLGHPFSNVQSSLYWSATTYAYGTLGAEGVYMNYGLVSASGKSYQGCVWPVRDGQSGSAAPVWVPLYRLYNSSIHDHYYVTIPNERENAITDSSYTYEKIEGFISDRPFNDPNCVPLYHLYSSSLNTHCYTADETEKAQLISEGYEDKGPVGYISSTWFEGGVPLYRLYNETNTDYFCTISKFEADYAENNYGFSNRTTLGYVSPDGLMSPETRLNFNAVVGSGVNTGNGNLNLVERTDFNIPGVNIPLVFKQTYNSLNRGVDGPLGYGWTHSFDAVLHDEGKTSIDDGTYVFVRWPDGHADWYLRDGTNMTPDNPAKALNKGCYDTLYQEWDGSYWITRKDQTQYVFKRPDGADMDAPAQFRTIIEKNGNSIALWYDGDNLSYITDTSDRQLNFTYYAPVEGHAGHIKTITDPLGRTISFDYDVNDNLTGFTDARGKKTQYQYNSDHQLTKIIYPEGNEVTNTYQDMKLISQKRGTTVNPLRLVYNTNDTQVTDENGNVTTYTLKGGQITMVYDPLGNNSHFSFGDPHNPTKPTVVTDKNGHTTTYTYQDGSKDGNSSAVIQRGNALSITNALNQTTFFQYDDKNNLTRKTDPLGHATIYEYDANKRNLIRITRPEGGVTNLGYTSNGQLETVTDPTGHTITYTYDANGNVTRITDLLGNHVDFTYDAVGRRLTRSDQLGRITTFSYDANDNLVRVVDADAKVTNYAYDANNNLIGITDARGKQTTYAYNDKDLLSAETDPTGRVYHYGYDDKGRRISSKDPDNNETTYSYDANNRLTAIKYNGATKVSFTQYDNNGNLKSMTDGNGTTQFTYDPLNRITSYSNSLTNKTVSYTYDAAGNRASIIYPGVNHTVTYQYDGDNRLTRVTDWLGGQTIYSYDLAGNLQSVVNPNGTKALFSYDGANRLTGLSNEKSDNSTIATYSFTLDAFGNHTQVTKNEPLAPAFGDANISYGYDDANKLTSAGGATYTYDNRGNLAGTSTGNVYSFDYADRLTGATVGGNVKQYLYDGLGNRIARTTGGVQTRYVLDLNGPMSQVLAETDSSGNVTNYYVYGHGLISKITAGGQRYCYHYDSRGSTAAITDSAENIVNKYAYDDFGEVLADQEGITNPFKYVGKYGVIDEGNGLLFMRARYYDAATGRFISKDPLRGKLVEPGTLNRYVYALGNPVMGIDPEGLESNWWEPLKTIVIKTAEIGTKIGSIVSGIVGSIILYKAGEKGEVITDRIDYYDKLYSENADVRTNVDSTLTINWETATYEQKVEYEEEFWAVVSFSCGAVVEKDFVSVTK